MSEERKPHLIEKYWTLDQAKVIKNMVAPDLTDNELIVFAHICHKTKLDPLGRQIYAIKRGRKMCIQTGIDGFRVVAERTGKYSPGPDTEFLYDENKRLLGAKVYVKKLTGDGTWHIISATALLSEYNTGSGLWLRMPHVMIEKCAEARTLRRAFPADLSGLYSDEEMDQADVAPAIKNIIEEAVISIEKAKEIDSYINGHERIRKELLKICKVESIEQIKESQLEACRNFVKTQKKKSDNENQDKRKIISESI